MKPINKGTTWTWEMKFWEDAEKTIPKSVSGYLFSWVVKTVGGVTVITKSNASFVEQSSNHRKLVLTPLETVGYTQGLYLWELSVTLPDTTVESWQAGTIAINE